MKRIRLWINELSLTQQLISIIFLFVAIFASFIFFFLTPAIDRFSQTEMYEQLHVSQANLIGYINAYPEALPTINSDNNTTIIQLLYEPETDVFVKITNVTIAEDIKENIRENVALDLEGTLDYQYVSMDEEKQTQVYYLYSMTRLKDGRYLISLLSNTYREQFRESMISGIVTMNVLVVSLLFVLLMIWVGSFLYPLSQIKSYITKIKNDQPATLHI